MCRNTACFAAACLLLCSGAARSLEIEIPPWQQPPPSKPIPQLPQSAPGDGCPDPPKPTVTRDAVTLSYSAITRLPTCSRNGQFYSSSSQMYLFCSTGSCGVSFYSGPHGYDPAGCSRARIDWRIWSWCGPMPWSISQDMWKYIADGLEVASAIALWPSGLTNTLEIPTYVKRSKALT